MVYVVVGIIANAQKEILVTQRPQQKSYSGFWEFPGGKKELQETEYQALVREFKEELDIDVKSAEPWKKLEYAYPEKTILLDIWMVTEFSGVLRGLEDQAFQWVRLNELDDIDFLPANKMILNDIVKYFS